MNIYHKIYKNDKPCIVLIHGWGATSDIWSSWIEKLSEHFCVCVIDVPGLGQSNADESEMKIENVIFEIEKIIPHNSILIGWSLGGMLSILLAHKLKNKIKALITIACNPCFVQRDDWEFAMPVSEFSDFQKNLLTSEKATLAKFFMLQVMGDKNAKCVLKQLKKVNVSANHSQLKSSLILLKEDVRVQLKALNIPSLHIYGEKDKLVNVALCESLISMSDNIKIHKVEGATHLPFISDQSLLTDKIVAFVNESAGL